jgi:hypothetical protein
MKNALCSVTELEPEPHTTLPLAISSLQVEAEFLDVIRTKVLRVFLLAIHSHLYYITDFTPPPSTIKLVFNVHRNLKSENSQDYVQKPQRNCTFKNSASRLSTKQGHPRGHFSSFN